MIDEADARVTCPAEPHRHLECAVQSVHLYEIERIEMV